MTNTLIPAEPIATRLLYQTYTTCAHLRSGIRKFAYYPILLSGTTLAIVIGIVEYAASKAMQHLRKPFLHEHGFDLAEWRSQCRTWQLEAAIQTVGEFCYDEIDPTHLPTFGLLLREKYYYESVRMTNQWLYMNENHPIVKKAGLELADKANEGMGRIIKAYIKDINRGLDPTHPHTEVFLKYICRHYDKLHNNTKFTLKNP